MDLLIHLGDAEGDEDSIAEMAGCRLEIVAGNNDFFSNLPREKELRIGSYRVLITHGHYYYVSAGIADIEREAAAQGCAAAFKFYPCGACRERFSVVN